MTAATKRMTGAELKITLDGLGLPPSFFADRCNCTMRTVVRWFDGTAVPTAAVDEIERICDRTIDEMRKVLESVGDADDVVLHTYRTDKEYKNTLDYPASWHRQMIFRVREHLEAEGRNVTVEYQ